MSEIETIERLCAVVEEQAGIIRDLSRLIGEQRAIDDSVKAGLEARCASVDREISEIYGDNAAPIPQ